MSCVYAGLSLRREWRILTSSAANFSNEIRAALCLIDRCVCVGRTAAGERPADEARAPGSSLCERHGELQSDQLHLLHLLHSQSSSQVNHASDRPLNKEFTAVKMSFY